MVFSLIALLLSLLGLCWPALGFLAFLGGFASPPKLSNLARK
jgi:hypothetical protein